MNLKTSRRIVAGVTAALTPMSGGATGRDIEGVILRLANRETRPAVIDALRRHGVPLVHIERVVRGIDRLNCEGALDFTQVNNPLTLKQLQDARHEILSYVQTDRLEALYAEVGATAPATGGAAPAVELQIAPDRFWGKKVKGLDRNTLYETFRQALAHEATRPGAQMANGTVLRLERAQATRGKLSVEVTIEWMSGVPRTISLTDMPLTEDDTPEELAAIALMTLLYSPALLSDPVALATEVNALHSVAQKLLISRAMDHRYDKSEAATLRRIINLLPPKRMSAEDSLARLIAAKKQLTDYLARTTRERADRSPSLELVPRTYVFRPASNQDPDRLHVVRPRRDTGSGSSTNAAYDPIFCYYYPWLHHYGYPGHCPAPWYLLHVAQGQVDRANAMTPDQMNAYAEPTRYTSPEPTPSVYRDPNGSVIAVDDWDRDQSRALSERGFDPVSRGEWRSETAPTGEADRGGLSSSTAPTSSTPERSSVRIDNDVITTTGARSYDPAPTRDDPSRVDPLPSYDHTTTTTTTGSYDATTTTTTGSFD